MCATTKQYKKIKKNFYLQFSDTIYSLNAK